MKASVLLLLVLSSSILIVQARQAGPGLPMTGATPVPQPTPNYPRGGRGTTMPSIPVIGNAAPDEGTPPDGLAMSQVIVQTYGQQIYRRAAEKELLAIAPPAGIANRFPGFSQKAEKA